LPLHDLGRTQREFSGARIERGEPLLRTAEIRDPNIRSQPWRGIDGSGPGPVRGEGARGEYTWLIGQSGDFAGRQIQLVDIPVSALQPAKENPASVSVPAIVADSPIELSGHLGVGLAFRIKNPKLWAGQLPLPVIWCQACEALSVRGPLDLAFGRLIVGKPGQGAS